MHQILKIMLRMSLNAQKKDVTPFKLYIDHTTRRKIKTTCQRRLTKYTYSLVQ